MGAVRLSGLEVRSNEEAPAFRRARPERPAGSFNTVRRAHRQPEALRLVLG